MSRGYGRVEMTIARLFARNPTGNFTTDELVARVYPDVDYVEKKHRVAVLRAARHVCDEDGWWMLAMEGPGSPSLFVNPRDETGYLRGYTRSRCPDWSAR